MSNEDALKALDEIADFIKNKGKVYGFARPKQPHEDILYRLKYVELPRELRKKFFDALPTIIKALQAKEPEIVSVYDLFNIFKFSRKQILFISKQYPNGIIIKESENE